MAFRGIVPDTGQDRFAALIQQQQEQIRMLLARPSSGPVYAPPALSWTGFAFQPNVGNLGSGFQACEYAKDALGIVHLRGVMACFPPAVVNGLVVANLPVGYRPPAREILCGMGAYGAGVGTQLAFRIDVDAGGGIAYQQASGVAWDGSYLSVSGITFAT